MLKIDSPSNIDPGSEVDLIITWDLNSEPTSLELRQVWNTSGKGDRDLKIINVDTIPVSSKHGNQRMSVVLPWGPYSFSGKLISLTWAFELVALPSKESVRHEFTMAPSGEEVRLQSVEDN